MGENDIAAELARLHELAGADYSRQVERIARRREFYPLKGEDSIFAVGGESGEDFLNLVVAARKLVLHGYAVYILPNPKGPRTADYILERKCNFKIYDLKTITGRSSVDNRLSESAGQTNRVILNITVDYKAGKLARSIIRYFERYSEGKEVMVLKGNKKITVTRQMALGKDFVIAFSKKYYK